MASSQNSTSHKTPQDSDVVSVRNYGSKSAADVGISNGSSVFANDESDVNWSPARVRSAAEYPPCPGERQVGLGATHASHAKPPVHPTAAQAVRSSINEEIPRGYVIAELYQDISPDVASGVYGEEGIPEGTDWPHEPISQSGSVGPEIAFQEGRDEWSPVPTQTLVAPDAVESHSYTGAIPDVCWMR